jgi:NAD(P)-dependent dehydrogenase (short-subunit alcohol dehydrogenase family)
MVTSSGKPRVDGPRAGDKLAGKVVAVTGGGGGIGEALCRHLAARGAASVAVVDINGDAAAHTAGRLGAVATAHVGDVSAESEVDRLITAITDAHGPIDVWCSNAGILAIGGAEVPTDQWQRTWDVNVMAHVWAARRLVPEMVSRGGGQFLITASAAGLLTQIGSAPYSVSKHAAVAFGEWLSITHGDQGIDVTMLCPQAVATAMTAGIPGGGVAGVDGMLSADDVAQAAVSGLVARQFYVLPHPEVATYAQRRVTDPERWLAGMRRLQARFASPPDAHAP